METESGAFLTYSFPSLFLESSFCGHPTNTDYRCSPTKTIDHTNSSIRAAGTSLSTRDDGNLIKPYMSIRLSLYPPSDLPLMLNLRTFKNEQLHSGTKFIEICTLEIMYFFILVTFKAQKCLFQKLFVSNILNFRHFCAKKKLI